MNGHGKLYYSKGVLAYDGQWFEDEFHGRGKIYNDEPVKLEIGFDYRSFKDEDKYWVNYEGIFGLI